jgi:hypothetical protein
MTKTEFYQKYGSYLEEVTQDNAEYGDHLILHPEEIHLAKKYLEEGLTIVLFTKQKMVRILSMYHSHAISVPSHTSTGITPSMFLFDNKN